MLLLERLQPARAFAKSSAAKVGEATDAYAPRAKEREAEENGRVAHLSHTAAEDMLVHGVHGFRVGDDRSSTLVVEPMTGNDRVHLGFSRAQGPFAIVLLREAARRAHREHFEVDLQGRSPRGSSGARRPPRPWQVSR